MLVSGYREVYDAGISTLGSSVFRGLNSIEDMLGISLVTTTLCLYYNLYAWCRDLSYNRIRTVDSHTFVNLPALSKV